jgi:mono/diheme cytochrome c family protein
MRKMRKRKNAIMLSQLLLICVVASACGNGDANNQETGNPDEISTPIAAGDPVKGETVYSNNCLACHGREGINGHNGPNLQTSEVSKDYDQIIATVINGGTMMPSFKETLTEEQIQDVAAYINQKVAR